MPITEVVVRSLGDLIDKVTPTEPDPRTGRRRDIGVYRGDPDASWPLLTSLDKLGGADSPHGKADLEEYILRSFIRYSRPYFSQPPVAAHFATVDSERDSDRVVWRLDWKSVHRFFRLPKPLASATSSIWSAWTSGDCFPTSTA